MVGKTLGAAHPRKQVAQEERRALASRHGDRSRVGRLVRRQGRGKRMLRHEARGGRLASRGAPALASLKGLALVPGRRRRCQRPSMLPTEPGTGVLGSRSR